jgi:hypothetical protein
MCFKTKKTIVYEIVGNKLMHNSAKDGVIIRICTTLLARMTFIKNIHFGPND